jgi:hypothetical protein
VFFSRIPADGLVNPAAWGKITANTPLGLSGNPLLLTRT